jgi:hypothetical protein
LPPNRGSEKDRRDQQGPDRSSEWVFHNEIHGQCDRCRD